MIKGDTMQNNSVPTDQPFWVDDVIPYTSKTNGPQSATIKWTVSLLTFISVLANFLSLLFHLLAMVALIFLVFKLPIGWGIIAALFVLGCVFLFGIRVYALWQKFAKRGDSTMIQQLAKERTGADIIGSAIHTAGHPLLQANQPVVLALKGDELSLYDYKNPTPLDAIRIKDVQSIDTVVYDEDRVPHIGVADNTAQALQITFTFRGNPCTCVFRRMYKVRAIEWYQALQTARLLTS